MWHDDYVYTPYLLYHIAIIPLAMCAHATAVWYFYIIVSGVGSIRSLRGPQIQAVGVALIIEFYDHNVPFLKVIF